MKKRRALALLLALSLAVGTNGMTVLATEGGMSAVSVTIEEANGETVESENPADDQQTGDSVEDSESDGQDQGEVPGGEDNSAEDGNQNSGDDAENPDAGADDVLDGTEDTSAPDDDIDSEEPEEIEGEPEAGEVSKVKMVTFTDDTGMKITYDAIAAMSFETRISAGVLIAVPDANGVVDLRNEEITSIDSSAFKSNTKITYVMLPKTVTEIGPSAFEGCTALKGVSISYGLTNIGEGAFKGCTALTQLALPNSVKSIGTSAFEGDNKLFMLHMVSATYSKLTTIGNNAFKDCTSLELFCSDEKYYLPASITTIGESAFENCSKISNVTMSDNITDLGKKAYQNCSGIRELTLSSGLNTISQYAFAGCKGLEKIVFGNANIIEWTAIDSYAFSGCSKLSNLELPDQINKVCSNAFSGCTALRRIEIDNTRATLDENAFPNENRQNGMCIVGKSGSTAYHYADEANIRFIATNEVGDEFYTYQARITGEGTNTNPKITVKVTTKATYSSADKDINEINNGANTNKGVKAGTICYFYYEFNGLQGIRLVPGSAKVNGVPIKYENNSYSFAMPVGGATITAEFERTNPVVEVEGDENTIEGRLSSETNYDAVNKIWYLKEGQSAKFYLTNAGSMIPATKVTYGISTFSESGVVSIDASGTVKALKAGTAIVSARVQTGPDTYVTKPLTIKVEKAGINHISMSVPRKDSYMTIIKDEETNKVTGISVPTEKVTRDYTFDLKADAFSMEEDSGEMAVAFTWTTSDAKVAKLAKSSTTTASSVNTVTIPKNTDGEATITVTATDENKNKITQKFVVSAQSYKPRLTVSKVTINPNQLDYTTKLEIVCAYGKKLEDLNEGVTVEILDAKTGESGGFEARYEADESSDTVFVYGLKANTEQEKSYSLLVRAKVMGMQYDMPLTIVVKKSVPNPTVSFDKKQPKINLFYANDGIEITPVISKLGTDEVSGFELEPLTEQGNKNYEDDEKFIKNFRISNKGVITQNVDNLLLNKSNKPVVTGYLVLHFKDYKDTVSKKYKITIPTETVAPSYALNKTSGIYNTYSSSQTVTLQLLDKKNKNAFFDLSKGPYHIVPTEKSTITVNDATITDDGMISFKISPENGKKVYLELTNDTWANGKSFTYTYTVKTNSANPTITLTDGSENLTTLKSSTVTLDPSYKEVYNEQILFGLKSNQEDTLIAEEQEFEPQVTAKLPQEQYDKLSVTYEHGQGRVTINESDIKNGTYSFVCKAPDCTVGRNPGMAGKVTLKVKIAKSTPTVTAKGTLSFNTEARDEDGNYIETGELLLTAKGLPNTGYTIDSAETKIECITKNYTDYANNFKWEITPVDGTLNQWNLKVSMKDFCRDGTYKFSITPRFTNGQGEDQKNEVDAKPISFSVKVYQGKPSVTLSAKGKLNLLDRLSSEEVDQLLYTTSNSIVYTPTVKNLKDTVKEAEIYDANGIQPKRGNGESEFFEISVLPDGKLCVTPKVGAELENNKTYKIAIWMKLANYQFDTAIADGGVWSSTLSIKTAQVLPKVTTDKSEVNLYLSNKDYTATFTVDKKDIKSIGAIESIAFGEKDTKAIESFEISEDSNPTTGKLTVKLKLKNGVAYGCNTTNKITMYVKFKGQGSNTTGTAITMNVKINK